MSPAPVCQGGTQSSSGAVLLAVGTHNPVVLCPADTNWTLRREAQADEDIRAGRVARFDDVEALIADLEG